MHSGTRVTPRATDLRRNCAPFDERSASRACVEGALARGEPFVAEQAIFGLDTDPSRGLVGVVESGLLVVYLASFDSALCTGADCPNDESGTTIWRCARLSPAGRERPIVAGIELSSACERNIADCFTCEAAQQVERCTSGSVKPAE